MKVTLTIDNKTVTINGESTMFSFADSRFIDLISYLYDFVVAADAKDFTATVANDDLVINGVTKAKPGKPAKSHNVIHKLGGVPDDWRGMTVMEQGHYKRFLRSIEDLKPLWKLTDVSFKEVV